MPTRRRPRKDRNRISERAKPTHAQLKDLVRKSKKRRRNIDGSVRDLLRYLAPEDANDVRGCRQAVLRFHDPRRRYDSLGARACKSPWCPWCPNEEHTQRTDFLARRIASIDPANDPKPRVVNVVWTLPPALHELARSHPSVIPEWKEAVRRTIALAYGYRGAHGKMPDKVCWGEMGAIFHLHAIGDRAEPWPKWAPHFDMLIPAWVRREGAMKRLRSTWPERYSMTADRYRDELRRALMPIVATGPARSIELQAFLASDFAVDWHVSPAPEGGVVHTRRALHRIRYSCRPLFTMDRAKLRQDEHGRDVLIYTPPHARREPPTVHRVPPGPAFGQLRSLRGWLFGHERSSMTGTMHGTAYKSAALLAGHKPVYAKEKTGKTLASAYVPGATGRYKQIDPRDLPRHGYA